MKALIRYIIGPLPANRNGVRPTGRECLTMQERCKHPFKWIAEYEDDKTAGMPVTETNEVYNRRLRETAEKWDETIRGFAGGSGPDS